MKIQLSLIGLVFILLSYSCEREQNDPFSDRIECLRIFYEDGFSNTLLFNYDNPYTIEIEIQINIYGVISNENLVLYYDSTWRLIKEELIDEAYALARNYFYDENNLSVIIVDSHNTGNPYENYTDTIVMNLTEEGKVISDGDRHYTWLDKNLASLVGYGSCSRWVQSNTGGQLMTWNWESELINFTYDQHLNPFEHLHLPPISYLFTEYLPVPYMFTSSVNNIIEANVTETHKSCEYGSTSETKYKRRNSITYDQNGLPIIMIIKDYPEYTSYAPVQVFIDHYR